MSDMSENTELESRVYLKLECLSQADGDIPLAQKYYDFIVGYECIPAPGPESAPDSTITASDTATAPESVSQEIPATDPQQLSLLQ